MTKRLFIETIYALEQQYDKDVAFAKKLGEILDGEVAVADNSALTTQIFRLLYHFFPPLKKYCPIQSFCYEENFGRSTDRTPEDLWDELQANKMDVEFNEVK